MRKLTFKPSCQVNEFTCKLSLSMTGPQLSGSQISKSPPICKYVNMSICSFLLIPLLSKFKSVLCEENMFLWDVSDSSKQTTQMDLGGWLRIFLPKKLIIHFPKLSRKERTFLALYCFHEPHQSMVIKPAFLPFLAQILFNQCNVTGLRGSDCTRSYGSNRLVFGLYCRGYNMIYGI